MLLILKNIQQSNKRMFFHFSSYIQKYIFKKYFIPQRKKQLTNKIALKSPLKLSLNFVNPILQENALLFIQ